MEEGLSLLRTAVLQHRFTWVGAVLGVTLGVAYAVTAPPGQPYDEPAHWTNVLFYAQQHRMPELGEPGSSYESQMGPVYYVLGAIVASLSPSTSVGFWVLRIGGVVLVPILAALTMSTARSLGLSRRSAALAAALVAFNPLLLAVAASVQNDFLMITLVAVAGWLAVRLVTARDYRRIHHAALGIVIGLAILTKVVALAVLLAVLITYLFDHGVRFRARVGAAISVLAAVTVVTGWWFVRNVMLYGDLTGAAGIPRLGISFPTTALDSIDGLQTWAGSIVSYALLPVEYYRNAVDAPGVLVLITLLVAAGSGLVAAWQTVKRLDWHGRGAGRRLNLIVSTGWLVPISIVGATVVTYLLYTFTVMSIAARLLAMAAPALAIVFVALTGRGRSRVTPLLVLALNLVVVGWLLLSLYGLNPHPPHLVP